MAVYAPILETQIGATAYLFGILGNGTAITITGIATFAFDSIDINLTWDEKENKDTTGNVQNFTQTNFKYEQTFKFNPTGSTRAAAWAIGDTVFTLQNLVIANAELATLNGTWRIKPGTKISLKMAENGSIDIPCEKYVNATQNSNLTGAPISG